MVNEDAVQRTFLIQNVARRRLAIYQNRRPLIRGPREGYRNFSEHRVQAAPRKKQDQTLKFMKHSLIKQTALGLQITQTISPLRTSNPSKSFPTSRKIDYRKKTPVKRRGENDESTPNWVTTALCYENRDLKILWTRPRRTATGSEMFHSWN